MERKLEKRWAFGLPHQEIPGLSLSSQERESVRNQNNHQNFSRLLSSAGSTSCLRLISRSSSWVELSRLVGYGAAGTAVCVSVRWITSSRETLLGERYPSICIAGQAVRWVRDEHD